MAQVIETKETFSFPKHFWLEWLWNEFAHKIHRYSGKQMAHRFEHNFCTVLRIVHFVLWFEEHHLSISLAYVHFWNHFVSKAQKQLEKLMSRMSNYKKCAQRKYTWNPILFFIFHQFERNRLSSNHGSQYVFGFQCYRIETLWFDCFFTASQ